MIKRAIIFFLTVLTMINIAAESAYSVTPVQKNAEETALSTKLDIVKQEENDIIEKVSFRDKFRKSPETQINNFFNRYSKYTKKNDVEKLKEMYSDDYINNDGFNKAAVFKMMEMAGNSYKDVKYNITVSDIAINGNYAVATVHETATGETTKPIEKFNGAGVVKSDIVYTDYLKKDGADWKITNTYIQKEKVELKYGEAKNSPIEIYAPECVPEGSEYEVTMNAQTPDGVFVVGSISNEPIVLPQVINKEVFRAVKSDTLVRVLKANKNGNNEYATASLAITRAQVEPNSVVINMTGMGFVMQRVNVIPVNKNVNIKEEGVNATTTKTQKSTK